MKLFASIIAAAALALGAADECTITTDAAKGTGTACADIAKCVDSLTFTYTGATGTTTLPDGCAVTGEMDVTVASQGDTGTIGGTKDTFVLAIAKTAAQGITVTGTLDGTKACVSTGTVSAGSCLGSAPAAGGDSSAAAETVASVAGLGAAAVAAAAALML